MRLILQRVVRASVRVGDEVVGEIGRGVLLLAGIEGGDGPLQVEKAVEKLATLRLFEDSEGRMNLDVMSVGGAFLVVSQFTLAASLSRGRRPSFDRAAPAAVAAPLVDSLVAGLRARGLPTTCGRFGAHMQVELINDGPVTFVLDVPPDQA